MIYSAHEHAEIPEGQRHANLETVRRVRETVSELVGAERRRRQAAGLIISWSLDRQQLDEAAAALGLPPLQDEEWQAVSGE
ncbi:hypothetical protein [Sphaerisporangium perillae]|uniref:hypothetical protein n=1 Tax=Sphaerisporangium perillae TaxID=2935860 RepID=UPI00200EEED5|nr:hypothetical protein [Sphaerisporangium perillae]